MDTTTVSARDLRPLDRHEAAQLAAAELAAGLTLYESLSDADWLRDTVCPGWRVKEVVAHLIGAAEGSIRLPVLIRHQWQGRRRYPERSSLDAMNEAQVDDRRDWEPAQLLEALRVLGPRAVEARRSLPWLFRQVRVPKPDGGRMTLGYLNDFVYPRDFWMHRHDIAETTGRPFALASHDRRLVEQVVRDVALAYAGPPVILELTGPAGGAWSLGDGVPAGTVTMDAVDYCVRLSGRQAASAPRTDDAVRAALPALTNAAVVF